MKSLFLLLATVLSFSAFGQEIFQLKKSKRMKNVLHFKANVANCKFKTPSVSNYWIIGEEDGRTEGLNGAEKPYFTPKISYTKDDETTFTMGALEKLAKKVGSSSQVEVRLKNCKPQAFIELKGQEIQIDEIFVNVNALMMPIDVTVKGNRPDGSPVSIKID